jgi:hypothetical protein
VQFLPRTPFPQDCGVISSISPCEGDRPGANPGFLTNFDFRAGAVQRSVGLIRLLFDCFNDQRTEGSFVLLVHEVTKRESG